MNFWLNNIDRVVRNGPYREEHNTLTSLCNLKPLFTPVVQNENMGMQKSKLLGDV